MRISDWSSDVCSSDLNLTTLEPGAVSALQHRHNRQDEFIYVLDGEVTLVSGTEEHILAAGMCVGFPAAGESHHLENRGKRPASYLEIGDRDRKSTRLNSSH